MVIHVPLFTPSKRRKRRILRRAKAFLAEILAAEERQFPSVGHGTDHRYRSSSLPMMNNKGAKTRSRRDAQG
jgi:hypothetical protein